MFAILSIIDIEGTRGWVSTGRDRKLKQNNSKPVREQVTRTHVRTGLSSARQWGWWEPCRSLGKFVGMGISFAGAPRELN